MDKIKKIQEKKDLFIQFSEEEMQEMGWEEGQKLSFDFNEETKSITFKPFVKMEIDISDWSREILEFVISESCERDISVNEVISEILSEFINENDQKK